MTVLGNSLININNGLSIYGIHANGEMLLFSIWQSVFYHRAARIISSLLNAFGYGRPSRCWQEEKATSGVYWSAVNASKSKSKADAEDASDYVKHKQHRGAPAAVSPRVVASEGLCVRCRPAELYHAPRNACWRPSAQQTHNTCLHAATCSAIILLPWLSCFFDRGKPKS